MDEPRVGLAALPNELLQDIFECMDSAKDVLNFSLTAKRYSAWLDDEVMWKKFAKRYNHWDPDPPVSSPYNDLPSKPTMKDAVTRRFRIDQAVDQAVHNLAKMPSQINYKWFLTLPEIGSDIKQRLQKHVLTPNRISDSMPRCFWARELINAGNRFAALEFFLKLQQNPHALPEIVAGNFDLFCLDDPEYYPHYLMDRLDELATTYKKYEPNYLDFTPRKLALSLASYIRKVRDFDTGEHLDYYDLVNNFITLVLATKRGMPIIINIIFAALCRRVGLTARLVFVGNYTLVAIRSPVQELDDPSIPQSSSDAVMYIDLFPFVENYSDPEVEVNYECNESNLRRLFNNYPDHPVFPYDNPVYATGADTARRIYNNLKPVLKRPAFVYTYTPAEMQLGQKVLPTVNSSTLLLSWLRLLLCDPNHQDRDWHPIDAEHYKEIITDMEGSYPWDGTFIEHFVIRPWQQGIIPQETLYPEEAASLTWQALEIQAGGCLFQLATDRSLIGRVIKHKRFGWMGVVVCKDSRPEMEGLFDGSPREFLLILDEDGNRRSIERENATELRVGRPSAPAMVRMAGRYFHSWCEEEGKFVSNLPEALGEAE